MWLGFKSAVIVICDLCPVAGWQEMGQVVNHPGLAGTGETYMRDPQTLIHETLVFLGGKRCVKVMRK